MIAIKQKAQSATHHLDIAVQHREQKVAARFFVSLTVAALSFVDIAHADPADAVIKQKLKDAEAARQQRTKDDEKHIMLSFTREDAEDKHLVFYMTGNGRDAMHSLCRPSSCEESYYINVMTKNASALYEACPSLDGDTFPCIVDFEHKGEVVTKIISARKPQFDGVNINQAGGMVENGKLCTSPWSAAKYDNYFGCLKWGGNVYIAKVNTKTWIVEAIRNGQTRYAPMNQFFINCRGTTETVEAYISSHLPPEGDAPLTSGADCK